MENNNFDPSFQSLNRTQMRTLKGGGVPSPEGFCCGTPAQRADWLEDYPFLRFKYDCTDCTCDGYNH